MSKSKEKKEKIIKSLKEKISKQKLIIFFDFSGIKSNDLMKLRKELKESGDELKIAKKTLTQIAFKDFGFKIDFKKIKAQLALVFGFSDEILPVKKLVEFSEKNPNLKILGGVFKKEIVGPEKIFELAKLPTRQELLQKFVGSIFSPISNFMNVLSGNLRNLIFILNQIQKVKQ